MHNYAQTITFRRIFVTTVFLGAVVILFMYSDNTLSNTYYDDGFFELVNLSYNSTEHTVGKLHEDSFWTQEHSSTPVKWRPNTTYYTPDLRNSHSPTVQEEKSTQDELTTSLSSHHSTGVPSTTSPFSSVNPEALNATPLINSSAYIAKNFKKKINASDYLVWSPECKIPNFDPFNKQAMKYHHMENYIACSKHKKLLSYVNVTDNKATLHIDGTAVSYYSKEDIHCCYSNIIRHGSKSKPDVGIKIGTCTSFNDSVYITHNTVKVSCKTKKQKIVYQNVHEAITIKKELLNSTEPPNSTIPISILFVGIDSISRLNLIRSMPKTYAFLANRSDIWLPLYGYNKIGENTFPNLMAIFTGYNDTEAYKICNPKTIGPLDSCRFIWKEFKKFGYITAYAEDESSINTFNYRKKGFIKEPVDYYFKPYMEAAESLGTVKRDTLSYCAGSESSGERIMNLAKSFAVTFKNHSTFGFFWMNTFSHNNINAPSRMDAKVTNLLEQISNAGILNNSIVIFLSDHGIRFGEIRHTFTGWLEERLPYIFFSFPKWFKEKYPEEMTYFQMNANRLTTPYDVYMTLQHILVLSGFNYTIKSIDTCPLCRSLFTPIGLNRSCETTGITAHWCTCGGYSKVDQKQQLVVKAAYFLIGEVQKIIVDKGGIKRCAKFHLAKILTSYISDQFSYKNDTYLLIAVETIPKAVFESTLHFKTGAENNTVFSIESSISRLDSYGPHSKCVEDERLKQYCFCK